MLVTEAEKKYGGGTSAAKLAAVIEGLYPRLHALIRLFVSSARLERLIERVLAEARKRWNSNPSLAAYISGKPPDPLTKYVQNACRGVKPWRAFFVASPFIYE